MVVTISRKEAVNSTERARHRSGRNGKHRPNFIPQSLRCAHYCPHTEPILEFGASLQLVAHLKFIPWSWGCYLYIHCINVVVQAALRRWTQYGH